MRLLTIPPSWCWVLFTLGPEQTRCHPYDAGSTPQHTCNYRLTDDGQIHGCDNGDQHQSKSEIMFSLPITGRMVQGIGLPRMSVLLVLFRHAEYTFGASGHYFIIFSIQRRWGEWAGERRGLDYRDSYIFRQRLKNVLRRQPARQRRHSHRIILVSAFRRTIGRWLVRHGAVPNLTTSRCPRLLGQLEMRTRHLDICKAGG